MDQALVTTVRMSLEEKPSAQLRRMYEAGNLAAWSPEAFEAMRQILSERGETGLGPLPSTMPPAGSEAATALATVTEVQPADSLGGQKRRESYRKTPTGPRPLASREVRLVAALIDALAALVTCGPGLAIMHSASSEGRGFLLAGLLLLIAGAVVLLDCQYTMLTKQGQTVGKNAMNVRIVRCEDAGNPGFVRAVVLRHIVPGSVCGIPCLGGLLGLIDILCIFKEERRCLHDYLAGTKVVEA